MIVGEVNANMLYQFPKLRDAIQTQKRRRMTAFSEKKGTEAGWKRTHKPPQSFGAASPADGGRSGRIEDAMGSEGGVELISIFDLAYSFIAYNHTSRPIHEMTPPSECMDYFMTAENWGFDEFYQLNPSHSPYSPGGDVSTGTRAKGILSLSSAIILYNSSGRQTTSRKA
jgi:hypothetical protein